MNAAITMHFCSTTYTSMQPLQCDSHPRVAEHQGRTDYALKRSKPHAAFALTAAPARAVRALERAVGPAAGVLGFPHVARGYRQGIVRRNISPEACRGPRWGSHACWIGWNGPSASIARRYCSVSRPCCSCSRRCTGHPAPALQLSGLGHDGRQQGPWARTRPFVPTQIPFRSCWCLPRAGLRGARRRPVQHPCPLPGASPSGLGARPFLAWP